ncbi:uncharacterized protein LOC143236027 isoform X1 [Tachypleus tridentatus]|uniref:uncharacterized protein LOC143236027 isoform X1 n=1 Tax=Tachypleus tridentatus TaxID=6853 RepID=UPI003FCF0B9A
MPRRKQSQGSENSTGAEKHETLSKCKRKLNQPGSSLSTTSTDQSSNNKILCAEVLSKCKGNPSHSCKVKEHDTDSLTLLSAKETDSRDVCSNSKGSNVEREVEPSVEKMSNRDISVNSVYHQPLTMNHNHSPKPICGDVLQNRECINSNDAKIWNQIESGSTGKHLYQEMVNFQDDVTSMVSKHCRIQDSNISLSNISEEKCSSSNNKSMKTCSKDRRDSAFSNSLSNQTESYLTNTESSILDTCLMLNTLSYNQCVRNTIKGMDDKNKDSELNMETLEQKTAEDITHLQSSDQEIPTDITSLEGTSTSFCSSTELKIVSLTSTLPSNTMTQVSISQRVMENSVSLPFMVYCPTIKAANVKSSSHIITGNNLITSSVSDSTVKVCSVESCLHSLTSPVCNSFTKSSPSKSEMGKSRKLSTSFQFEEENTDVINKNQKMKVTANSICDPLVSYEEESTSLLNERLRLKIPETKVEEFSTLLDGSVTVPNQGTSHSAKSVKSPIITSPQILEERISKLISENAAIVETLDPLWSWRYTRQSSISSSQNIESELKKCRSAVRMRRYSEDSSLAKNVTSNVSQYLGSKFQFALMEKGISESCKDINKIFISSQELSPLHDSDKGVSVLEKVDIHEEAFQQHTKNSQRSIIKDLLLKDRSKGETIILDLDKTDKPLVIETTNRSPPVSFLCRLCNTVFHSRENLAVHQQNYCRGNKEYLNAGEENLHFLKGNTSSNGCLATSPPPLVASVPQLTNPNPATCSLLQHGKMLPPNSGILLQTSYHGIADSSHLIKKSLAYIGSDVPPLKKRKVADPAVPLVIPEKVVEKIMSSSELPSLSQTSQYLKPPSLPQTNQYSKSVFTTASAKMSNKIVTKVSKQDLQEFGKSQHFNLTHVNSTCSTTQESNKVKITESGLKCDPLSLDNPLSTSVVVTLSKPVLNSEGTILAVQSTLKEKINSEVCLQDEHLLTSVIFEPGMSSAVNSSKKINHEELFGKPFPGTSPINLGKAENAELVQGLLGNKLFNAESYYRTSVSLPLIQDNVHKLSVAEGLISDQRERTVCSLISNYNVLLRGSDTNIPGNFSEEAHSECSDQYQYKNLVKTQPVPENMVHSPCSPFFPSSVIHLALDRSLQNDSMQSLHQQSLNSTMSLNIIPASSPNIPTSDRPLPLPASTQRVIANDIGQIKRTKPTRPSSLPLKKKVITMVGSTLISPETPRSKKHCIQQYINGHAYTYLGLKCSTRSTYCSIYRPQPMYVPQDTDPKLSMYSNWQVVPAKNIMLGLSPSQMIGLYDSRQKLHCCSGGLAVTEESSQLLITHSSYWTYRCQEQEKASKPKNLSRNLSESELVMNQSENRQCISNCVEMVRPEESKVQKLSNSLEPDQCSRINGNDMDHSPFSTSLEQESGSVRIKHIVKVPCCNEQLISPKPVELVISDKSKQFISILDQNDTLSKPLVSATSSSQLLYSYFQDQQLQLTKSSLSLTSPKKSKQFTNILDQDSSLSKPVEPVVCSGRKNKLLYSQLQDQQLHLPKPQQFMVSPGGSKQSLLIESEAQQWCTANSPELGDHKEEQLQHRPTCKSLDSLVSPCGSKPCLNQQCDSKKLGLTRSQKYVTSAEGQKFIMPPNHELQWEVFQSVEHLNSPGRRNPILPSHDQKQQQNSPVHTMSVTSPERSEQLETKYSCVVYKQKSNHISDNQEENQTTTSINTISVGGVPQTQNFLSTTYASQIITLSSPNCGLIQPSVFKNVSNNSLSPSKQGGRESDETSDSFQNIKLVEPTTDEESTQSEPLNDNESIPLPKRVRIFEGGFKSNEDYTYVRGRGRGKYVCEECGIRCKKPSMLKKHIRTHTDLRPFSCSHCSFAFKTKGNLTKHMKSKAHHKKCVELGIVPVPTTIDDSQIDAEALAKQEHLDQKRRQFTNGEELDDDEEDDFDEDAGDSCGEEDTDMEVLSDQRSFSDQGSLQSNVTISAEKNKDPEDSKHEAACCLLNLSSMPTVTSETYSETEKPTDVLIFPLQESLHVHLAEPSVDENHASQHLTVQGDAYLADSVLLRPSLSCRTQSSSVHTPLSPSKKVTAMALAENHTDSQNISLPMESVASHHYSLSIIEDPKENKVLSYSSDKEQIISKNEDKDHCLVFSSLSVTSNSEDETSVSGIDQPMDLSVTRDMKVDPKISADSHPEEPAEPVDSLLGACLQYGSVTALKTGGLPMLLNTNKRSQSPWELQQHTSSRQSVDDRVLHLSPVAPLSPDDIPSRSFFCDDQCPTSSRPQAEFIVAKSGCGQRLDDGKCVCDICNKTFTKPSQLRLHLNIHYFERPFRCDNCVVSFRTKGHLQKHKRSVSHYNKVNMNQTFGTPTADNPRPFKCSDCKIAFRIHGHLAKHLRSKMHIMKLECLGRLPFGMYAEMERSGTNLNDIDTTDCDSSLETLQLIAQKLYHQEPRQVVWQGDNVIGGAESPDHSISSPESIALSLVQNKQAVANAVNLQVKHELDKVHKNPDHSHQNNSNSLSVDIDNEVNDCLGHCAKPQLLSCPLCGQSFVSAKALRVHTHSHHAQWSTDEATNFTEIELASSDSCTETPQKLLKFASVQDSIKKHCNL